VQRWSAQGPLRVAPEDESRHREPMKKKFRGKLLGNGKGVRAVRVSSKRSVECWPFKRTSWRGGAGMSRVWEEI